MSQHQFILHITKQDVKYGIIDDLRYVMHRIDGAFRVIQAHNSLHREKTVSVDIQEPRKEIEQSSLAEIYKDVALVVTIRTESR